MKKEYKFIIAVIIIAIIALAGVIFLHINIQFIKLTKMQKVLKLEIMKN